MDKQKVVVILLVISLLFSVGAIFMTLSVDDSIEDVSGSTKTIIQTTNVSPPTLGTVGFELVRNA